MNNKQIIEEFNYNWVQWIKMSEIKTGVNFNNFRSGVRSWHIYKLSQQRQKFKKMIEEMNNNTSHPFVNDIDKAEGYFYAIKQIKKVIKEL